MAEPLGVAFVEIEPVTTGFRAKTEAQLRTQLAGVGGIPPSPQTAAATKQLQGYTASVGQAAAADTELAAAQARVIAANEAEAASHNLAAAGARRHALASREATEAVLAETASVTGLRGASLGVNPAFLLATAGAIAFFQSADEADKFAEKMHLIEFATHANEEQMKEAKATAEAYGQSLEIPGTSAVKAADAIEQLTHAGFDLADSQLLAKDTLLLSAAASIDLGESTSTVARLLRAYNLDVSQAAEVTDALTAATLSGTGSTEEWAGALTTLAPLAHALGLDVRETSTLLIQFAQGGVSASQATALLRLSFARIAAGSKPVKQGLKEIGLSLKDLRTASGALRPDAFVVLSEAVAHLDQTQRQQAVSAIFGARAGARLLPILDQSRAQYDAAAASAQQLGITQEEAETRTRNLAGKSKELKSNLSDLGVTIGRLSAGPLAALADGLATDVEWLDKAIQKTVAWTTKIIHLATAIPGTNTTTLQFGASVGKFLDRTTEGIPVLDGFFETMGKGADDAEESTKAIAKAEAGVRDLFAAFKEGGGGLTSRNELVLGLQALVEGLDATTPAGKKAIAIIEEVIRKVQGGGKLPPVPVHFDVDLDVQAQIDKARGAGDTMTKTFLQAADAGLTNIGAMGLRWANALADGARSGAPNVDAAGKELAGVFTASLGTQFAEAQAAGASDSTLLGILNKQLAEAQKRLANVKEKAAAGDLAAPQQRIQAESAKVTAIRSQIEGILSGQESDARAAASKAKSHADAIEKAADERDAAFVRAIQTQQGDRQGAVSAASATPDFGDDIKADVKLRDFLTKSITATKERIRQVRAAGRDAQALVAELGQLRASKNQVRREIDRIQKDQREQARATRVEQAQLDLQITEARIGDDPTKAQTATLVSAHQKVIAALRKQQSLTKKRSVEWKRLQLEIEQEKAAIRDLRKAQKPDKDTGDPGSFAKTSFAFLQTLQGFSSNLAGNLIPGGATGGLVGGTTAPAAPATGVRSPFAPRPEADKIRPVSTAQGNLQIALLREIRDAVKHGTRKTDEHPEAKGQRRRGSAAMDYSSQGTHGM